MTILDKAANGGFPLTWANLDAYKESKGHNVEV